MRFLLLVLLASGLHADETKIRVALVGDGTVTDRAGWGAAFTKLLGPYAECINFADGGQSSKSFRESGNWKKVIDSKPTHVLIQFGHNDMPGKGPDHETDPATTYRQNLIRYIAEARAIGAKPILVTSLTRRVFSKDKIRGELKPWADAATKVAAEREVPLVDLFTRSVALHNQLGPFSSAAFNPPSKRGGTKTNGTDGAHLSEHGAAVIAKIIAEELRKVEPEFSKHLQ
ncbi:rhamnogalacturonan acetylesterase [Prosthecobacter sp.]|jgi:lysophospholipase L1-like esterase|uniref:rhamnogalacturonan acetylesterase n=1 Tax=Prosthecobacter sp. TaxID=1965333 RepID=UPI003784CD76